MLPTPAALCCFHCGKGRGGGEGEARLAGEMQSVSCSLVGPGPPLSLIPCQAEDEKPQLTNLAGASREPPVIKRPALYCNQLAIHALLPNESRV